MVEMERGELREKVRKALEASLRELGGGQVAYENMEGDIGFSFVLGERAGVLVVKAEPFIDGTHPMAVYLLTEEGRPLPPWASLREIEGNLFLQMVHLSHWEEIPEGVARLIDQLASILEMEEEETGGNRGQGTYVKA